jgi:hypothetical protein
MISAFKTSIAKDYREYRADLPDRETLCRPFVRRWSCLLVAVSCGIVATTVASFFAQKGTGFVGWFDLIIEESGLWETLTAINLLLSGVFFLSSGFKNRRYFPKRFSFIPQVMLGFMLCIGAGEEISWGQHWLGFGTLEGLRTVNEQSEFNLHNINTSLTNRLMVLFCAVFIGFLPLLQRYCVGIRYVVERLGVPIAPLAFVPYGFISLALHEYAFYGSTHLWFLGELRETLFSFVALGIGIHTWLIWQQCRLEKVRERIVPEKPLHRPLYGRKSRILGGLDAPPREN